jgi:hypothetical protein
MSYTSPLSDFKDQLDQGVTTLKADVSTKSTGGTGGTEFTLTNGKAGVKKIKVTTDTGSKTSAGDWSDRQLIKDIHLTWTDNTTENITDYKNGNWIDFDIDPDNNEKITKMTIRTGGRVDKIYLETDKEVKGEYRTFSAGQENGSEHEQTVGKGILYGFHGTYDKGTKELISLGTLFKS